MRRPSPASVLALLLVVGTGVWLGWYAYRGELRSLVSATPTFEIDMPAPPVAPSVDVASDSSVPSITIDIPPEKPPAPVAVATATIPPVAATPVAKAPVAVPPHTSLAASSLVAAPAAPAAAPPHTSLASVPMVPAAAPPHASLSSVLAMATPPEVPPPAAPLPSQAPQPPLAIFPVQGIKPAPTTPVIVSPLASATLPPAAPPKMTAVPMSATPAAQPQEASLPPEPLEAPPPPELRPAGLQPSQPASISLADASLAPAIGTNASAPAATGAVVPLTPGTKQASVIDNFMPPGMNQQDLPAWQRYARPFDAKDPRPRIAIVITKLGLLHGATAAAIDKLPADVTLSFSPYALDLPEWMAHARTLGHEIMLDLPMDFEPRRQRSRA